MHKTDTHLHLDEQTAVPLGWVWAAFLAGLGLLGLVAGGIWWAASLQSNVENQGEKIETIAASNEALAESYGQLAKDVSEINGYLKGSGVTATISAPPKGDGSVLSSAYTAPTFVSR